MSKSLSGREDSAKDPAPELVRNVRQNKLFKKTLPFTLNLQESWSDRAIYLQKNWGGGGKERQRRRRKVGTGEGGRERRRRLREQVGRDREGREMEPTFPSTWRLTSTACWLGLEPHIHAKHAREEARKDNYGDGDTENLLCVPSCVEVLSRYLVQSSQNPVRWPPQLIGSKMDTSFFPIPHP